MFTAVPEIQRSKNWESRNSFLWFASPWKNCQGSLWQIWIPISHRGLLNKFKASSEAQLRENCRRFINLKKPVYFPLIWWRHPIGWHTVVVKKGPRNSTQRVKQWLNWTQIERKWRLIDGTWCVIWFLVKSFSQSVGSATRTDLVNCVHGAGPCDPLHWQKRSLANQRCVRLLLRLR